MTEFLHLSCSESRDASATTSCDGWPHAVAAEADWRPELEPGVELIGELQGSGFQDRQWLINRGDRFIQVTDLLYRIAEQADGGHTLDEIAGAITQATGWLVTADQVRQLIESRLIPAGLIIPVDETVDDPAQVAESDTFSPVALNMHMRVLGPRVIDPVTKVLQMLYAPPVLAAVLAVIVLAHAWLYLIRGAGGDFFGLLNTPDRFMLALAVLVVSGVFHEFGHASALRYGGGTVRGMGAGLYMIYPVFYTDVTDGYRLGRWARLRIDLGGVYFHLIFAVGLMGLYLATGFSFLLFVAWLIDFAVLWQFLPFGRFDGYWALADLMGMPDLFSQVGPFLRSIVSDPGSTGAKLPPLKPWVKAVFSTYIILTFPVVAFFFFLLFRVLPNILRTSWYSLLNLSRVFNYARSDGDVMGMMQAAVQAFILTLIVGALVYLAAAMSRRALGGVWRWSKPTMARRIVGATFTVGALVIVAYLWLPLLHP